MLILIVLLIVILVWAYNSMVAKKNEIANAYGAVDAVLKNRFDLIPNLVAAVQEYMDYEQETLKTIVALRTRAMSAHNAQQKWDISEQISSKLQDIMLAVEQYPELKSSQNMLQLQQALAETEGQISAARRTYNQAITNYNNACAQIPTNIFAAILKYQPEEVLQTAEREKASIDIQQQFKNFKK